MATRIHISSCMPFAGGKVTTRLPVGFLSVSPLNTKHMAPFPSNTHLAGSGPNFFSEGPRIFGTKLLAPPAGCPVTAPNRHCRSAPGTWPPRRSSLAWQAMGGVRFEVLPGVDFSRQKRRVCSGGSLVWVHLFRFSLCRVLTLVGFTLRASFSSRLFLGSEGEGQLGVVSQAVSQGDPSLWCPPLRGFHTGASIETFGFPRKNRRPTFFSPRLGATRLAGECRSRNLGTTYVSSRGFNCYLAERSLI